MVDIGGHGYMKIYTTSSYVISTTLISFMCIFLKTKYINSNNQFLIYLYIYDYYINIIIIILVILFNNNVTHNNII